MLSILTSVIKQSWIKREKLWRLLKEVSIHCISPNELQKIQKSCSLAQNSVSNLINSCPCEPPCLQNIFTNEPGVIDFNAAVSFIEDAQKSFIQLDDDDQDVFIINKFKESIINIDE